MPFPIIYINSWPGVGKHTIAKELEKQMDGRARVVSQSLPVLFTLKSKSLVIPTETLARFTITFTLTLLAQSLNARAHTTSRFDVNYALRSSTLWLQFQTLSNIRP